MLKYYFVSIVLKAFSSSKISKNGYRYIGNYLGNKKRASEKIPSYYYSRINRMLRIKKKHGIPRDGDKIIEIGTGWLHWDAIIIRLFFDVTGVLFDVWDNRQIDGLKNYLSQLDNSIGEIDTDEEKRNKASKTIKSILEVENYNELYNMLGFEYIIDEKGSLDKLNKKSFDIVVSSGVLEHIYAENSENFVNSMAKLLKHGGYSVHSINIRDHLTQYDSTMSQKQYLKYSNLVWRLFFENKVQYFNRIQRSEWHKLFVKSGFVLLEEEVDMVDISNIKLSNQYKNKQLSDLECGGLNLVHKKP